MTSPLVSVVIPVYNSEQYLRRCLNSVLNQYYSNIEIILVNDGSTDNSKSICSEYKDKYPDRIFIFDQPNQGASIARKRGIEKAKGEYIMFVDSDDFVSPHYVSALYEAITTTGATIALCPMKRVEIGASPDFADSYKTRVMNQKELLNRFFKYEFWGYPGGCYKSHVFDNITFPEATVNEDYYVKAQILSKQDKVAYIDTALYFYEQHAGSLSKQPLSLRALGEFDNASATWKYIKANASPYSSHALAIASEAACKWLGVLNDSKRDKQFQEYRQNIKNFCRKNIIAILTNPQLLWKIKPVIIYNLLR